MKQTFGLEIKIGDKVQTVEHTFSHLKWNISVYEAILLNGDISDERLRWVDDVTIENYPFPVSHQKIIQEKMKRC